MIAVTSFSKTGYEEYGHRIIESCIHNWPGKLIVYAEFPLESNSEKIEIRDFFSIPNVQTFLQYIQTVPFAHGKIDGKYNYNYDLWKFSRKVFAQWDVLKENPGKVFWLDADSFCRKPIPEAFLENLFTITALDGIHESLENSKAGLVFLGREGLYTETGIVGFDTKADRFDEFLNLYINCLRRGAVFNLQRWHDCEVFDWARKASGIAGKNLSPFFKMPSKLKQKNLEVIKKSVLGEYLVHLKGNRKKTGLNP